MKNLVLHLQELKVIHNSFVSLYAIPIFVKNKFDKSNPLKFNNDYKLGAHTASSSHNEKNYDSYRGYKSHILTDASLVYL